MNVMPMEDTPSSYFQFPVVGSDVALMWAWGGSDASTVYF